MTARESIRTGGMPTAERLLGLVQSQCGLFNSAVRLNSSPGDPRFSIAVARLNNLRPLSQGFGSVSPHREEQNLLDGAGSGLEDSEANVRAIAEGLERYSTCVFDERQFIWARANELRDTALDLDTVARCSETELLHPGCPIKAPAKDKPIRWVRGISLWDGGLVWIPAIMVYLYMPALSEGERFWLPISTGCAAHTTIERALVNAICEVVERDAISLTWLCRLPLPRIELDSVPGWLLPYLARNQQSAGIWQQFFDATSDIGVPTVYSVQEAPHNQNLATLVMCSTELDPAAAIAKVIRESAASRIALQTQKPAPADWDDFSSVSHGAVFMGRQEQRAAFDFLRHSTRRRQLSEMKDLSTGDTRQDLIHLIKRFRAKGMEVFAVDLSTDEAIRAGMRVVRVIVPGLQPLSFSHRARYLGHPRLVSAMSQTGYEERTEAEINPWPQPFA